MGFTISGIKVNRAEYDKFRASGAATYDEWKNPPQETGTISISSSKAKRLGVPEDKRHSLTREQLTAYESGSGQYNVRDGKTFLAKTDVGRLEPETAQTPKQSVNRQEPIDIGGPQQQELTGLAKLREEDSIIGAAVRVATDWKTTVALVGTLATIATLGATAGAAASSTATVTSTVSAHRLVATRLAGTGLKQSEKLLGIGVRSATRNFVGKAPVSGVSKLFKAGAYATNSKTAALTTSTLTKAGMSVGVAAFVATTVGTYPFAKFELAEATDKIGIAIFQAANAGDVEEVERLVEYLEQMTNPSTWDSILNKIPFANVFNNVSKNIKAALVSANSIKKSAAKKLLKSQEQAEQPTFEEKRETSDIAARERDLENRKQDEEYFTKIAADKAKATKESREQDAEFYAGIDQQKRENELKERAEDKKYYAGLRAEEADRKATERKADEEYWANIFSQNEKRKSGEKPATIPQLEEIKGKPLTQTEKKKVSDWNAGKSTLNFLWLGL